MSLSVETLAVARKYTDDSLAGAGAVAGVPCKIQSITAITGGNRVTFLWTDNNGDDHTSAMDVMNGVDGEDGKGIQSVTVNAQDHLIITYTDGTTVDAGQIEIHNAVDSVNGQTGAVVLDAEDVGALPDNTPIPSKTSDLTNDSGFATTSDVSTALADYTTTADLTTLLAAKQDTLTFDNVPTENSNNPVKSGGVYSANQTLTNYDANTGVKNLFDNTATNETSDGVTFTVSTDKRVSVVGTLTTDYVVKVLGTFHGEAGKQYLVTGGISSTKFVDVYNTSAGIDVKDTGNGVTFTPQSDTDFNFAIVISGNGSTFNDTFSPMIRPASITDSTYQPYAKTNKQLTQDTTGLLDNLEVNGAVNMLPNTATTQTINGVTFTVNSDGTVTANGTATANAVLKISDRFTLADYIGRKYVDAKKNEASSSTYSLIITYRNGSGAYVNETYVPTEGFILSTISNATLVEFGIFVKSGQSVSNLTFKPMITVASYNGDYVPYAKSNKELTEKIDIVGNLFTTTTKVVDNITHGIATTIATLENLPIGIYVVSGQFNSDSAMSGGGLIQFASSGVIQNGASCNPMINQGFKANAGLTGIFNVTNATNQINLQIYTATADLTVTSARLAAIRIA